MEYYPSNFEMEQHRIVAKKKKALLRITRLGLTMPYISDVYTYEQILTNYTVSELSNTEQDFLKNGIESLFKCLKSVQRSDLISKEETEKHVISLREGLAEHIDKNGKDIDTSRWIDNMVKQQMLSEVSSKKTTEEVLIREIAEFKVRLGRVNVIVVIENDAIQFKDKKKMEQLTISLKEIKENPFPNIFIDTEAYILFENLHSVFYDKNSRELLADFSMIYRRMHIDKLIIDSVRPIDYIKWIQQQYDIPLGTSLKKTDNPLKIRFYEKLKILR